MGSASVSMLILDHGSADEDTGSSIITAAADQNHKIWLPPTNTNSKGSKATSPRRLAPTGPVAPVADMYGGGGGGSGGGVVVGPPHLNTLRSVRSNVSVLPSRSSRPRQIPAPSAAPPPPPPVLYTINLDESDGKVMGNKKSSVSSRRGGGSEMGNNDDIMSVMTGPVSISGGRRMIGHGGGGSIINFPMGGNGHPGFHPHPHPPPFGPYGPGPFFRPGPGGGHPPPGAYLVPMPVPVAPGGKKSKGGLKFGTFSARGVGKKSSKKAAKNGGPPPGMMMMPPHHPLALAPPPMALGLPVPMMAPPLSMRRPSLSTGGGGPSAEEPIYMPSHVRPLSPIASYAPAHFPHEAYLMHQQHYAAGPYVQQQPGIVTTTLTRPNGKKSGKADKKASKKKQKAQQQQLTITGLPDDMDDVDDVDLDEDDAEHVSMSSGAGIYRKGHLNERAFSYSIRQEHRSRSYSSLVAAGTGPSPSGGYGGMGDDLRAHDKKERELIQMVHDLDLSVDDDLERSQVPLAMYPPHHRRP